MVITLYNQLVHFIKKYILLHIIKQQTA